MGKSSIVLFIHCSNLSCLQLEREIALSEAIEERKIAYEVCCFLRYNFDFQIFLIVISLSHFKVDYFNHRYMCGHDNKIKKCQSFVFEMILTEM